MSTETIDATVESSWAAIERVVIPGLKGEVRSKFINREVLADDEYVARILQDSACYRVVDMCQSLLQAVRAKGRETVTDRQIVLWLKRSLESFYMQTGGG